MISALLFGSWIFCFAVIFCYFHRGWQPRRSFVWQQLAWVKCFHRHIPPVWGLSASVASVCRGIQTQPLIHNRVVSCPGWAPALSLSSRLAGAADRWVGRCVHWSKMTTSPWPCCLETPICQTWQGRGGRVSAEQRADEDPVLGSCDRGQGVTTHRAIIYLWETVLHLSGTAEEEIFSWGKHQGEGRQWINEPSESLRLSYQGLYSVKNKARRTITDRFTDMCYDFMHSLYTPFIICSLHTQGGGTSQCYESLSAQQNPRRYSVGADVDIRGDGEGSFWGWWKSSYCFPRLW